MVRRFWLACSASRIKSSRGWSKSCSKDREFPIPNFFISRFTSMRLGLRNRSPNGFCLKMQQIQKFDPQGSYAPIHPYKTNFNPYRSLIEMVFIMFLLGYQIVESTCSILSSKSLTITSTRQEIIWPGVLNCLVWACCSWDAQQATILKDPSQKALYPAFKIQSYFRYKVISISAITNFLSWSVRFQTIF